MRHKCVSQSSKPADSSDDAAGTREPAKHSPSARPPLRYYADANPEHTGCSSYGFEFDLFEGLHLPLLGLRMPATFVHKASHSIHLKACAPAAFV